MTTFTDITDATLTQDKPLTQAVTRALRDNPVAITEGAAGAPKVQNAGLFTLTPGTIIQALSDAAVSLDTTNRRVKEIICPRSGTVTVDFVATGTGGAGLSSRIYVNDIAVGTVRGLGSHSEDIAVQAGDKVQIYARVNNMIGTNTISSFRIKTGEPVQFVVTL